ncbi:MFS transporter [Blastococcus sp. SYSU DS1024]
MFGTFLFVKLLSMSGIWIHNVVAVVVAYEVSGSVLQVGLVTTAQFAPQLVLSPLSGALADRGNRKVQIVVGRLVSAAGAGGLVAWYAVVGTPTMGVLLTSALIVGVGFTIGGPALKAIVPALVRPNELAGAVALDSIPMVVGRTGGPVIGVLTATLASPAAAFALSATFNLVFALTVASLKIRDTRAGFDAAASDRRVRAAFRYLRRDPALVALLVGVAAVGYGSDPAITLAPALAERIGGGTQLVGWFASTFGLGAGAGVLTIGLARRWLGLARAGTIGLSLMSAGICALAVAPHWAPALAAFAVAGLGFSWGMTSFTTGLQVRVPDVLRGRVMAFWLVAFLGARPVASLTNGVIAESTSLATNLLLVAAVLVAAAYGCRPSRVRGS